MANEIRVSCSIRLVNGLLSLDFNADKSDIDQTIMSGGVPGTIDLTTTAQAIDLSELGIWGSWMFLKNLDDTNSIEYGPDDGASDVERFGLISPGEPALFRKYPGTPIWAKTAAGTAKLFCAAFAF